MYTEKDLLPLSALQHYLFCQRQCALIHIEQLWTENLFTAQGRIMHERVDKGGRESRYNIRRESGTSIRSLQLGLIGKADMVEFHRQESGTWLPFPVEYKRGRPKKEDWDKVQLCAQGLCLEEMLGTYVPAGALFYGKNRRRQDVTFNESLRRLTAVTAENLHELIRDGTTPKAAYQKKCDTCSLLDLCRPKATTKKESVKKYLGRIQTS